MDGNAVSATSAASTAGSAPSIRVVFLVDSPGWVSCVDPLGADCLELAGADRSTSRRVLPAQPASSAAQASGTAPAAKTLLRFSISITVTCMPQTAL